MKNAILAVSTLTTIGLMIFINKGMDSVNNVQSESLEEVNEMIDEVIEQQEASLDAMIDRRPMSVRLRELCNLQQAIFTSLVGESGSTANEGEPAEITINPSTPVATLAQQQADIVRKFTQFEYDLGYKLEGIADQRHVKVLDSMKESEAAAKLDGIRVMLFNNKPQQAAAAAKTWAVTLALWSIELESMDSKE